MNRKITIVDVANYAGVSVATVSLALNGKGTVSLATINKINEAIAELGYIRNKNASVLRSGNSGLIGLIVRDINCTFDAEIITGIDQALTEQSKMLFLIQLGHNNKHLLNRIESLVALGIEGLIFADGSHHALRVKSILDKRNIPFVVVAKSSGIHNIDIVKANNWLGAKKATELLIHRGHRNFAYLGGNSDSLTRAERIGGFGDTLSRFGLKFRSEWILDNEQTTNLENIERLLKYLPSPSAFLCHDERVAITLFMCAFKCGRSIYKTGIQTYLEPQIELICFDINSKAKMLTNFIHCIDSQPQEIGRQSVHCLLNMRHSSPQEIIIPPKIPD